MNYIIRFFVITRMPSAAIVLLWLYAETSSATFVRYSDKPLSDPTAQITTLTPLDGLLSAGTLDGVVGVHYEAAGRSHFEFASSDQSPLAIGSYFGALRYPFNYDDGKPGMGVGINGSGPNELSGNFHILNLALASDGSVDLFDVDFEQHWGGGAHIYGQIRYNKSDAVAPIEVLRPLTRIPQVERSELLGLKNAISNHTTGLYIKQLDGPSKDEATFLPTDTRFVVDGGSDGVQIRSIPHSLSADPWTMLFGRTLFPLEVGDFAMNFRSPVQPLIRLSRQGMVGGNTGIYEVLQAEFDTDGNVQRLDILFKQFLSNSSTPTFGRFRYNSTVPEPATFVLFAIGCAALSHRRR